MLKEFNSYYHRRQRKTNAICLKMRAGKERKRIETYQPREPRPISLNNLSTMFKVLGLEPLTEYRFCDRRWRFDYAFFREKIAVEYEGLFSAKSRHTSIKGFINDCEKYNTAAMMGWRVFRITAVNVKDGSALRILEWIKKEATT